MNVDVVCPHCGRTQTFPGVVPFRAECDSCATDLHTCTTCRLHDRYSENECREDQADPVANKDRRNLCEYWKPIGRDDSVQDEAARARARLEALFGGPAQVAAAERPPEKQSSAADEAKRKLDELFRKKP